MKTLILNYKTWRCGVGSVNQLGIGTTKLLNSEGYMCCLGQFSLQLSKEVKKKDLLDKFTPREIGCKIPVLNKEEKGKLDSKIAHKAVIINDNSSDTPVEKIGLLRKLFKTRGYKIKVKNAPKSLKSIT